MKIREMSDFFSFISTWISQRKFIPRKINEDLCRYYDGFCVLLKNCWGKNCLGRDEFLFVQCTHSSLLKLKWRKLLALLSISRKIFLFKLSMSRFWLYTYFWVYHFRLLRKLMKSSYFNDQSNGIDRQIVWICRHVLGFTSQHKSRYEYHNHEKMDIKIWIILRQNKIYLVTNLPIETKSSFLIYITSIN